MFNVMMPDLGEGIVEGEIIQWLKQVGDIISQDEPLVLIMTDKAMMELPALYSGKLVKQYYTEGQKAIRHLPLYDIESLETNHVTPATALPKTRALAKSLGIDINQVVGTGVNDRITDEDVKNYVITPSCESVVPERDTQKFPLTGIKALMAEKIMKSYTAIPHFSYFEQIVADNLIQSRLSLKNEMIEDAVTFMPLLIQALSLTIDQFPLLNSSFNKDDNTVFLHKKHNIGIAINTSFGLIVPVLKNVQDKDIFKLVKDYNELIHKASNNMLKPSDMQGGTITISNFGSLGGGLFATPIINFPESAILGIAKIQKQPIIKDDQIAISDVLNISWSFDHRIIDGAMAIAISSYFRMIIQKDLQTLSLTI